MTNYLSPLSHFLAQPNRDPTLPFVDEKGVQRWYNLECEIHRDGDLPAVVYPNGYQEWYQHGLTHRDGDLPALILPNGNQEWFQHGKRHRENDLPAKVDSDGYLAWYLHGNFYYRGDHLPSFIHADNGTQGWRNSKGQPHRENDLPAVVHANGFKSWYLNGLLHRITGPARIYPKDDGEDLYFLKGVEYTYEEWLEKRIPYLPVLPSRYARPNLL